MSLGLKITLAGIVLAGFVPAFASAAGLRPRVVRTQLPTADVVIASKILHPPEDAAQDAAPLIQNAIEEMAGIGGGVIFLSAGRYLLDSPLTVRRGVILRGDWAPLTEETGVRGTILMPVANRGHPEGPPAITLERGSGIRELTIWYPNQDPTNIVPYPWTVRSSKELPGNNYTVLNVTMVNPYQAIRMGPEWNELHYLRNIVATPLRTGIWIDFTTDIGRINNVDLSPRWWEISGLPGAPTTEAEQDSLRHFLRSEAIGVDIGRSDWQYLYQLRVDGYYIGLQFRRGERGAANGVMFASEIINCGTALLLKSLNHIGFSVTGSRFSGQYSIRAPGTFTTLAQFNTCQFEGEVLLEGSGLLTFQNCCFISWRETAIKVDAGQVSIINCDFKMDQGHLRLGPRARRALMISNRFPGQPDIEDRTEVADVQISHAQLDFARPDISPHNASLMPRPRTAKLFLVTDFGASPGARDNTEAFQRTLDAAGEAGGGTVYVPAGNYRFEGELIVPSGVELRGIWDVPHHTDSGGSVLMPTSGRGNAEGTPFIQLQPGSGLRGLTFWYPNQNLTEFPAFPWTVRALGPNCWLVNITMGNSDRGADFWTYPSTGHVIRYLAGAFVEEGLWVSKSDGEGWIEDVQMNPHYSARVHPSLPPLPPFHYLDDLCAHQRRHLQAIVLGNLADQHLRGTFVFGARDFLVFRDDNGGANARVIMHGSDLGPHPLVLEAVGEGGVEFINTQLVPYHPGVFPTAAAIHSKSSFQGQVSFFNTQIWGRPAPTAILEGPGTVLLQQLHTTHRSPIMVRHGHFILENAHFVRPLRPHVHIGPEVISARIIGCLSREGKFDITNEAGERLFTRGNSASFSATRIQ